MNTEGTSSDSVYSSYIGERVERYDFEAALQEADRLVDAARTATEDTGSLALSYHLNTRGFLHLQLGHYQEALADCTEARGLNPDLDQNNLMTARLFVHYYESVIVPEMEKLKAGLSVQSCTRIAMAYHDTGFYANAANYFHLAISVAAREELPELYNSLSGSCLGAGFIVEAFIASGQAMSLEPEVDSTNFLLSSWQLEGMGVKTDMFLPEASSIVVPRKSLGEDRDDIAFYLNRDYASTLDRFNHIIDDELERLKGGSADGRRSRLPGFLNHRAFCHLNLGHFDQAIEDCLLARRLDVNIDHTNLRLAQFFKAEYDHSLRPLFAELEQNISADAYNRIGVFFFSQGFYANAATYFQLAASISEGLVKAESYNNLAGAYLDSGLTIDALRASHQARSLNPSINEVNFNLAAIRLKPMGLDPGQLLADRFEGNRNYH